MNILFVVHQFFPDYYAGSERLVLNWCKQLQRSGHRVRVLTYGVNDNIDFKKYNSMLIKRYLYENIQVISVRHQNMDELVSFRIYNDYMSHVLKEILTEEQLDLVHVCHPMRLGLVVSISKELTLPVVLTLTDFWLMCPRGIAVSQKGYLCSGPQKGEKCLKNCFLDPIWGKKIEARIQDAKHLIDSVEVVVSGTHFLKSMFQNNGYRDNIKIIRFGENRNNVGKNNRVYDNESTVTIGYLSSLNPHKGAHILLQSYQKIDPPNVRLKIFGDPIHGQGYFKILKRIAKGNPKIEFCGKYQYDDMSNIFKEIDITAVPSIWWENSPLVLLRSLAYNVPAIVSDLGGLVEIIADEINGFTFKIDNKRQADGKEKDLTSIIKKISNNPSILNSLKSNIKAPPRIEEEVFEYECLYREILQK